MKAVILAGGFGTRITEESVLRPKPMIEIGGKPILWHIMKIYQCHGINDFIICCGYKGHMIKQYFSEYYLHRCDVTFDFTKGGMMEVHTNSLEPWKVTLVDTGLETMTGGRLKRIKDYIGNETFCMTYGDGVSNVDITASIEFHKSHGKFATMTIVNALQRFGVIDLQDDGQIKAFREKDNSDSSLINGGFMVLEPEVLDYIEGDSTVFEKAPLEGLAKDKQLMGFRHHGFWQCMDTQRDKNHLEELWNSGKAPWKLWK